MRNKLTLLGGLSIALLATGCASHRQTLGDTHYELTGVSRSRILIDQRYDAHPDRQAETFILPYKQQVDSIMGPVVGETDHYMAAARPESELSNLLADIMVWEGKAYNEQPDFGIYNMGGIRAALPAGKITYGNVLDVSPFENKICFLTLTGDKVLKLFREIAHNGGEGVSRGLQLVITSDGRLKSASLNGKEIDPKRDYRIATLDYVAQGNDGMTAFKEKSRVNSPQDESNNFRYIIINYFREQTAQGKKVNARVEGRIKIEK